MWFNPSRILSYNRMLNFVVGSRGGGKTFNTLELCIRRYLKYGKQFIYLRRYDTELESARPHLFDAIRHVGHFPDTKFGVAGKNLLINDEVAGYCVALTKSRQYKGTSLPDCDFILFDEFLIDQGRTTYIKGEVKLLLDLIETVGRMDTIRVMCLSNAITVSNIYFDYFGITPRRGHEFTKHPTKPIIVQMFADAEYIHAKQQTEFGRLIEGTTYEDYAINNSFVNDSYSFISPLTGHTNYIFTFMFHGKHYGVYFLPACGIYHINRNVNHNCPTKFAFTTEDHQPNYLLFKFAKSHPFIVRLKYAYDMGFVYFDSLSTKNVCYELFNYL